MYNKFAWTLTSLLGVCVLFFIVYLINPDMVQQKRDPSLFLIPQDFEGMVTINYDQMGFAPLPRDGAYIVYEIPPDGILNTSTPEPPIGTGDDLYVEVDEAGNRQEIPLELIQGGAVENKQQVQDDGHLVDLPPVQYFHVLRPAVERVVADTIYPEAVVWEDSLYLTSVEQVPEEQLDAVLGEVKRIVYPMPYADGDTNFLKVGNRYYAIKGQDQYEEIAVEKDGVFIKALRQETYR